MSTEAESAVDVEDPELAPFVDEGRDVTGGTGQDDVFVELIRDPELDRALAIREAVDNFEEQGLPVPPYLQDLYDALGEEGAPDAKAGTVAGTVHWVGTATGATPAVIPPADPTSGTAAGTTVFAGTATGATPAVVETEAVVEDDAPVAKKQSAAKKASGAK